VFILGPSHHVYTRKCVLSRATHYGTPMGERAALSFLVSNISVSQKCCCFVSGSGFRAGAFEIDQAVCNDLRATRLFEEMSLDVDQVFLESIVCFKQRSSCFMVPCLTYRSRRCDRLSIASSCTCHTSRWSSGILCWNFSGP
jgi:Memo-like protein